MLGDAVTERLNARSTAVMIRTKYLVYGNIRTPKKHQLGNDSAIDFQAQEVRFSL